MAATEDKVELKESQIREKVARASFLSLSALSFRPRDRIP